MTKDEMINKIYEDEDFKQLFWWKYFISNYWRVWVSSRKINNRHWTESLHRWHFYNYTKSFNKWSPKIRITFDWKSKMIALSRLVWMAFLWLVLDDKKTFVCHKDDDVNNNNVNNLFLWTCKVNMIDMATKMRWATRKLNWWYVYEIRKKYVPRKYTIIMLSKEYSVSYFTIYAIIKWISWKW